MKYTIGILTSLALVSASHAVSVTTGLTAEGPALTGGTQRGIFDNAGDAVLGGYVGYGTFADIPGDIGSVVPTFNEFGAAGTVDGTPVGAATIPGTYLWATSQPVGAGDPLADADIFIVIGNEATLDASTELLVVNTGLQFGDDDPTPGIINYDLSTFTGDPTFGSSTYQGTFTIGGNDFSSAPNSFQLQAIPEPSSSLLFGFAGLALLIRRKR